VSGRFDELVHRIKQLANEHAQHELIDYKQRRALLADWAGINRDIWLLLQPRPGQNRWRADKPSRRARASVWLWCELTSGHERAAPIASQHHADGVQHLNVDHGREEHPQLRAPSALQMDAADNRDRDQHRAGRHDRPPAAWDHHRSDHRPRRDRPQTSRTQLTLHIQEAVAVAGRRAQPRSDRIRANLADNGTPVARCASLRFRAICDRDTQTREPWGQPEGLTPQPHTPHYRSTRTVLIGLLRLRGGRQRRLSGLVRFESLAARGRFELAGA
jgi:hypothetical protein